jgi:hypothetical protein
MARGRTLSLKVETEVKGIDKLDKLGDKLAKTGKAMTIGLTVPLVAAGATAIKFASDLEEATSKAATVFTDSSQRIQREAQNLDDAFSEATFLDTAGTFGALLQSMGLTEQAAADLSLEWLKLSQDMASFHNTKPEEALAAIQSALAGEFEPLKRYGVLLNAARLEQKALELGIYDGVGALDAQGRTLALNAILFEDQEKVVGDFARTADGFANSSRIMLANFEDAMAQLGTQLLPIATEAVQVFSDMVTTFAELPEPVKETVVQFAALLAVAGPLLYVGGRLLNVVKLLEPAFLLLGTSTAGPIAAAAGAFAVFRQEATSFLDEWTGVNTGDLLRGSFGDDPLGDLFRDTFSGGPTASFEMELAPELTLSDDFGTRHINEVLQPAIDNVVETFSTGADTAASVFAEVLGEAPQRGADELLANQFVLKTALEELTEYMKQSLTPAQQMFNAQGFLQSQELANGLVSNNPYVRTKAQEMQAEAIAALRENLYLAMDAGANLASTYASGIVNNLGVVVDAGRRLANSAARPITIESEPPDPLSPLRGITKWGGNLAATYAAGMLSGTETVTAAARGMVSGISDPAIAMPRPGRSSGVVGGIVGGNVTNINLTFTGEPPDSKDERELVATLQRLAPFIDGKLAPGY